MLNGKKIEYIMDIRIDLNQSQVQKPIITIMMSPQMQQAIQLLQLPILELNQRIEQEMAQNPVLEEVSKEGNETEEGQIDFSASEAAGDVGEEKKKETDSEELKFQEEFNTLSRIDDEWRDFFQQSSSFYKYTKEDEEKRRFLENTITRPESLQEHLERQMKLAAANEEEQNLGMFIIGNIDSSGFLKMDVEELSAAYGVPLDEAQRVLEIIQTFDPNGIGSRNLRECLLLQLKNTDRANTLAYSILEKHFAVLGKKKYIEIAKALKVKIQDVQEAVQKIMRLTLRPGQGFGQSRTQYIVPDVAIRKDNGDYEITVSDERLPHLRISDFYRKMMQQNEVNSEVKEYIKEKIHSGKWLIKNIHQRQETLYNISFEIIKRQKRFLNQGVNHLEPLTMHQIAEAVSLHESTVSRAIANKYIDTPHGLFPLKYFFTTAIETTNGKDVSSRNVKHTLQQFIAEEDSQHPLSDEVLVKKINERGIKIARRTVAKYRKELGILPSHLRKQY